MENSGKEIIGNPSAQTYTNNVIIAMQYIISFKSLNPYKDLGGKKDFVRDHSTLTQIFKSFTISAPNNFRWSERRLSKSKYDPKASFLCLSGKKAGTQPLHKP